ncbi:MAG TPA: response regulator [Blastocatellia bacterium]|nr:response regulator [Blastocatellia bacterium]
MEKTKGRILCVDDDRDNCALLEIILGQSGYEVTSAMTVDVALGLAKNVNFDLYLLDTILPDGTGIELCQKIRTFDPSTPILFCSGAAYQSDINRAFKAGAQGYIVKPMVIENLLDTVTRCLTSTAISIGAN